MTEITASTKIQRQLRYQIGRGERLEEDASEYSEWVSGNERPVGGSNL